MGLRLWNALRTIGKLSHFEIFSRIAMQHRRQDRLGNRRGRAAAAHGPGPLPPSGRTGLTAASHQPDSHRPPTTAMTIAIDQSPRIRESVLRDPRYPVSRIADRLLPYLQILDERFSPVRCILVPMPTANPTNTATSICSLFWKRSSGRSL